MLRAGRLAAVYTPAMLCDLALRVTTSSNLGKADFYMEWIDWTLPRDTGLDLSLLDRMQPWDFNEAGVFVSDLVVGDVCDLPFEDQSFDCVLSLNGFHAFPAKERAWLECRRVLRPGGTFCGCTYVAGEEPLTDWWVACVHEPLGFFSRPFETRASLTRRLERMYATVEVSTTRAIACFRCTA